jgi:hypothetical protein
MMKLTGSPKWLSRLKTVAINRLQLRQVWGVMIAALLAFGFAMYLQLPSGYWIIVSALLGFYFSLRLVMQRQFIILMAVAFFTALLAFATSQLANYTYLLAFFLLALTFVMVYLGLKQASLWAATFIASFYAILSAGVATTFAGGIERFYCIVLGFAIAIFVQIILMRGRLEVDVGLVMANSLLRLARLSQAIFLCYVTHNYEEEHFNYEKKLHKCRSGFLYEINQARYLLSKIAKSEQQHFYLMLGYIEQMYEILQSLSLLINRVKDHSTFSVADKEFLAISSSVDAHFRRLAKAIHTKEVKAEQSNVLSEDIYELEEINRTVLQVVAEDPLVIMIFIQDLYALDKTLVKLSDAIIDLDGNKSAAIKAEAL